MNQEEPQYRLVAQKRALIEHRGQLVQDSERLKKLPDEPAYFVPFTGNYKRVADEAVRRNEAQKRSGFIDYLFSPDPVAAKPVSTGGWGAEKRP